MDDKYEKKASEDNQRSVKGWIAFCGCTLLFFVLQITVTKNHTQVHVYEAPTPGASSNPYAGWRVLYLVTTLSEYDSGARNTERGFDRMQETLIPVVRESVESMMAMGFVVDVGLICHYDMTREYLIRDALPYGVGLQVWDAATPIGYKLEDKKHNYTQDITRALARQHRYIIKDKFAHYDLFVNFEDDMLISGESVRNYIEVTEELYRLRSMAPDALASDQDYHRYDGAMSKHQLQRMLPGFMRVEALLDEETFGAQDELDPVPVLDRPKLDPKPCCHLRDPRTINKNRPLAPESDKLVLWETNIRALGIRKMPPESQTLDWVLMLRGPRISQLNLTTADFWAGKAGYFQSAVEQEDRGRPDTKNFAYVNNQGGWMATRHQIWEWHTDICPGGFLPPFEDPEYHLDGLDMRNVEYWSGGLNIYTKAHGCNLQRIIPLDPDKFARSLLYHTANNKQRQLHGKRSKFVKVNDLLGELHTVRKDAEAEISKRS